MKFSDIKFNIGKADSTEVAATETANPMTTHDLLDTHSLIEVECGVFDEPSVKALVDVDRRVVYPLRNLSDGK